MFLNIYSDQYLLWRFNRQCWTNVTTSARLIECSQPCTGLSHSNMKPAARLLMTIMLMGVLCLSVRNPAGSEDASIASMINIAGLQRMLSQRIGKAYCQLGLAVDTEISRQQLHEAIDLFSANLVKLEDYAASRPVRDQLQRVRDLWTPIKAVAGGPVNLEGAKWVAYWSDDLLFASHKVVQLLQDESNTSHGRLVNISGRRRMLSQRLAKLYMLQVWGVNTLTIQDELETAKNEFTGALAELQAAPENTDAINRRLTMVARDWTWFRKAMNMVDTDPFPKTVADVSETILVNMHEITRMYEEQADKAR